MNILTRIRARVSEVPTGLRTVVRAHPYRTALLAIVALIAGVLMLPAADSALPDRQGERPVYVLHKAEGMPLAVEGVLAPRDDIHVAAKRAGALTRVYAAEGAHVNAGDVLAVVGQPTLVAQRETLRAQYAAAEAQSALAEASAEGTYSGAVTEREYAASGREVQVAQASEAARDALNAAYLAASEAANFLGDTSSVTNSAVNELQRDATHLLGGTGRTYLSGPLITGGVSYGIADRVEALLATQGSMDADAIHALAVDMLGALDTLTRAYLEAEREVYKNGSDATADEAALFGTMRTGLARARADLAAADKALQTARVASEGTFMSAQSAERTAREVAEDRRAVSRTALAEMRARLNELDTALGEAVVRAPFTGIVTDVFTDVGAYVTPGTPLMRLHADGAWEAEIHIPEQYLASVRSGQIVHFADGSQGIVDRVAPLFAEGTGAASVFIALTSESAQPDAANTRVRGELMLTNDDHAAAPVFFAPHRYVSFDFDGPFVRTASATVPVRIVRDTERGMYMTGTGLFEGSELVY